MKLAEAKSEREALELKLELLERRLSDDLNEGRRGTQVIEEYERTADLIRDLNIAIGWTEQNVNINGLPLGSYLVCIKHLNKLAEFYEKVDRERADRLRERAFHDFKFIRSVSWQMDLRIPPKPEAEKEET